jgi:hypothetical protein
LFVVVDDEVKAAEEKFAQRRVRNFFVCLTLFDDVVFSFVFGRFFFVFLNDG